MIGGTKGFPDIRKPTAVITGHHKKVSGQLSQNLGTFASVGEFSSLLQAVLPAQTSSATQKDTRAPGGPGMAATAEATVLAQTGEKTVAAAPRLSVNQAGTGQPSPLDLQHPTGKTFPGQAEQGLAANAATVAQTTGVMAHPATVAEATEVVPNQATVTLATAAFAKAGVASIPGTEKSLTVTKHQVAGESPVSAASQPIDLQAVPYQTIGSSARTLSPQRVSSSPPRTAGQSVFTGSVQATVSSWAPSARAPLSAATSTRLSDTTGGLVAKGMAGAVGKRQEPATSQTGTLPPVFAVSPPAVAGVNSMASVSQTASLNLNQGAASAQQQLGALIVQQATVGPQQVQVQVVPEGMGSIVISVSHTSLGVNVQVEASAMQTVQWLQQSTTQVMDAVRSTGVNVTGFGVSFGQANLSHNQSGKQAPKKDHAVERLRPSGTLPVSTASRDRPLEQPLDVLSQRISVRV